MFKAIVTYRERIDLRKKTLIEIYTVQLKFLRELTRSLSGGLDIREKVSYAHNQICAGVIQ